MPELDFAPSQTLQTLLGLGEGLKTKIEERKKAEAAKSKSELMFYRSVFPTLFRVQEEKRQFEITEKREAGEFGIKQALEERKFSETQLQNQAALEKIKGQITAWQEGIRIDEEKLTLEKDRVGLEERRVANAEMQTLLDGLQGIIVNQTKQLEEIGRTTRSREGIASQEGIAARALGGIKERFTKTQDLAREESFGKVFDDELARLASYQEELAKPDSPFRDAPEFAELAVNLAKKLNKEYVQITEQAHKTGALVRQPPAILEIYKDDPWYRRPKFGIKEVSKPTSLLPTLTKPKPTGAIPSALPKPSDRIQRAIDAAKAGGHKSLSDTLIAGLKNAGLTDEEIEQVEAGL